MANELNIGSPSGATIYAIIRKAADSTVWNGAAFVAWNDPDIAAYDIPLTDRGGDYYSANFPTAIAAGTYFVSYYLQSGGTPATTDFKLPADEELFWTGSVVITPPPGSYTGRYTTLDKVLLYLDATNYAVHTDADRDGVSDVTAAVQGHSWGEARVDFYTRGPYTFNADAQGESVALMFEQWATIAASYRYAQKRGLRSNEENEFARVWDEAVVEMQTFAEDPFGVVVVVPDEDEDEEEGTMQMVPIERDPVIAEDEFAG